MKNKVLVEKWDRKEIFDFFNSYDDPYTGVTTPINITNIIKYIKDNDITFYEMLCYIILQSINDIDEFKYCLEQGKVYKYDHINLSCTVLDSNNIMQFTNSIKYSNELKLFLKNFRKEKQDAELLIKDKEIQSVNNIYISCVPWFRITSVKHPSDFKNIDSNPRITWGKIYQIQNDQYIDLSIQVNHAFQDGYHIGLFIKNIESKIDELR